MSCPKRTPFTLRVESEAVSKLEIEEAMRLTIEFGHRDGCRGQSEDITVE
jgi:hypothetical protein